MVMQEFHALVDEAKKEIQEITPADLKKMQQRGDDFILVDVREKDEAAKGMIPSAVNVTRGTLELNIDQVTTDKNKKIVLYCGGGSRSALAALSLKKMGFKNLISLAGGYKGWIQSK
ncbi:MAG TPA: rhodanese-like domain-containing protein [Terriglobales bacterium]|nr:rhodanese-like domain-containing protein [Terriglobales bacterium]